jgi:hypothetical protein
MHDDSPLDFSAPARAARLVAERVEATLRRLYLMTLATAVLGAITLTVAVVAIITLLRSSSGQADLLNRLGRQRMLLQRIGVAELAIGRAVADSERVRWSRIAREAVTRAGEDWNALRYDPDLPPYIGKTLDDISPLYQSAVSMGRAATARVIRDSATDRAVADYLEQQQVALAAVDSTMKRYVAYEDARLARARTTTMLVAFVALVLLVLGTFGGTLPMIGALRRDSAALIGAREAADRDALATLERMRSRRSA